MVGVQRTVEMGHELIQEKRLWKRTMEDRAMERILKMSLAKKRSAQVNLFLWRGICGIPNNSRNYIIYLFLWLYHVNVLFQDPVIPIRVKMEDVAKILMV